MPGIMDIVLPTFLVILVGYFLGKKTKFQMATVVDLTLYLGSPAIAFVSLLNRKIVLIDAAKMWAAAVVIMAGCGIAAWIIFTLLRQNHSGLYVSIAMMNTMNIPFPLVYLAYGAEGLLAATLFYIPNSLAINSVGIYVMAGKHWRESIKEVFKLPVIYAAILGLMFNFLNVQVPDAVMRSINMLALMTLPLILLILGYNLASVHLTSLPTTLLASFLRMGVGLALGLLMVDLLHITGIFRSVLILDAAMPAAANSSLLASKFNNEAELVSSVVFCTTLASIGVIPLLLHLLA
ncbi:MAG: AEC family transporter [Chloroflexota bacterium]